MKVLAGIGLVLLAALGAPAAAEEPARVDHVVLVALGGGVTSADMTDETRMPWLAGAASVHLALSAEATRPHAGAIELLTGRPDPRAGGGHPRPEHPTLMERVREQGNLPAEQVWFVSYDGGDALALAYSSDGAFGRPVGPSVCTAEGAFGAPLAPLLETLGRPVPTPDATWDLLRGLRRLGAGRLGARLPETVDAASPAAERVERALLAEIDRRAALVRGPVARDVRALGAAGTVLAVHRPVLTVVRLGDLTLVREDADRPPRLAAEDAALAALQRVIERETGPARRAVLLVVGEPYHAGGPPGRAAATVGLAVVGGRSRGRRSGKGRLAEVAPAVLSLLGLEAPTSGTDGPLLRPKGR
jgi:hypothetical protein